MSRNKVLGSCSNSGSGSGSDFDSDIKGEKVLMSTSRKRTKTCWVQIKILFPGVAQLIDFPHLIDT